MKLIGSKTEREFERELINSTSTLLSEHSDSPLLLFLQEWEIDNKSVMILDSFPDDGSIFYLLLIENRLIGQVEIDSSDIENATMETMTLPQYMNGLSKMQQIKLAMARSLMDNET